MHLPWRKQTGQLSWEKGGAESGGQYNGHTVYTDIGPFQMIVSWACSKMSVALPASTYGWAALPAGRLAGWLDARHLFMD